ncbi:IclR family transcriptional regulator [Haloarcula laminariae]|uniref:IclR family transcriptional regulator n=1 Tax=Haloarcula laminariae TaxID=2961577 RepID=UPI0021C8C108|nr:IclR family transcriptional regulator [Halomicroarcula laminariae]
MEKADDSSWRTLQTVERASEIIQTLAELDGAGVSAVAERLDISVSSAHSHLATLHETGFLLQQDGQYHLSYRFLHLGEYVRNSSDLYRCGRSEADKLADKTGHYVHLFTEENGMGINLYEARGEHAEEYDYQSLKLQRGEPLHISASGKAVLATLPEEEVRAHIRQHGLESYTANTITEETALFEELNRTRERGYAVNDEEEIVGYCAVAAPIQTEGDAAIGSISVAGPTRFFDSDADIEEIADKVMTAANMTQVNINMSTQVD